MTTPLEQLAKYLKALGLETECREHPLKQQLQQSLEGFDPTCFLQKIVSSLIQQVIVKGEHGEVSVIYGEVAFGSFEIYCREGDLFEGIRRYKTVTDCGRTIYSLLTSGTFDENIPRVWDTFTDFLTNDIGPDGSTQKVIDSPFKNGESF